MLGKLMKYEFMAMGRIFVPMYAALIAVTIISRLLALLPHSAPIIIGTTIASVLVGAVGVITFILIIQRFMKNLLSDEGYLMMTLPVKTDSLILSKMFVATIFSIVSFLVSTLAILVLSSFNFAYNFQLLGAWLSNLEGRYLLVLFQALVIVILAIFGSILLIYTCMSLSMLVNKRRGLMSFGVFVGITTIIQIIVAIATTIFAINHTFDYTRFVNMSYFAIGQLVILIITTIALIQYAVFYFITRYMLKRRLNLL
ncbi:MAG: hypothetical protein FWD05_10585 [Oscillospiraceae bacterium]|nr:hypothetical protein [Oscillospiraceae bacterium]